MTKTQRNAVILKAIADQTARALVSQKAARQTLISERIYTSNGKLRAEFGGDAKRAKTAA